MIPTNNSLVRDIEKVCGSLQCLLSVSYGKSPESERVSIKNPLGENIDSHMFISGLADFYTDPCGRFLFVHDVGIEDKVHYTKEGAKRHTKTGSLGESLFGADAGKFYGELADALTLISYDLQTIPQAWALRVDEHTTYDSFCRVRVLPFGFFFRPISLVGSQFRDSPTYSSHDVSAAISLLRSYRERVSFADSVPSLVIDSFLERKTA